MIKLHKDTSGNIDSIEFKCDACSPYNGTREFLLQEQQPKELSLTILRAILDQASLCSHLEKEIQGKINNFN